MKKLIACAVLGLICLAISCSKEELLCGCSPINDTFSFVIKNAQNQDLLDTAVNGAFDKMALKVTYKSGNSLRNAAFNVGNPFPDGSSVRFPYHYVNASLGYLQSGQGVNEAYIDFGNGDTDTLNFAYDSRSNSYSNVLLNNQPMPKEPLSPDPAHPVYAVIK